MSRREEAVELPTTLQLKALGSAMFEARVCLQGVVRTCDALVGANDVERRMVVALREQAANALKPFERKQ